jgi:hypothetical protein
VPRQGRPRTPGPRVYRGRGVPVLTAYGCQLPRPPTALHALVKTLADVWLHLLACQGKSAALPPISRRRDGQAERGGTLTHSGQPRPASRNVCQNHLPRSTTSKDQSDTTSTDDRINFQP